MSASPANARLGLTNEVIGSRTTESQISPRTSVPTPGHEALEALLAFSALHEQIQQRRAREVRSGAQLGTSDVWELEQFVLDEVLQLVAERALAITGSDGVAIALAEGDEIVCRASAGTIAPDSGVRLDPNSGFSGTCFRSGQIVRCDNVDIDPRVNVQACQRLGARSMVAVPLAGQRSVLGLLEAFSTEAHGFNDSDVRSLKLLAELILAAMKPEEEDRLAEIAQRVATRAAEPTKPVELPSGRSEPAQVRIAKSESIVAPTILPEPILSRAPVSLAKRKNSRPGIMVVFVLVLLAVALGSGLWWNIRHRAPQAATSSQQAIPTPRLETQPVPASSNGSPEGGDSAALAAPSSPTGLPKVTGIRHWSAADSSTVVIDLEEQVQYEAHRLSDPERIYFDLHHTGLAPGLFGKTIEVGDGLLVRVRVAQPVQGVTRVVLETKGGSNFSVSLESNPYRLVVEVRKIGAEQTPQAKTNLFNSVNPPASKPLASAEPRSTNNVHTRVHLPKFRIALDAGHGGWDLGTVGRKGLLEKDLVLDIVERLGNLVERRLGAEVIYTRDDDTYVALEKRAEIANVSQADLFVSVHANYSSSPRARGVETYYSNTYSSLKARSRETDDAQTDLQTVSWNHVDIREKVLGSRRIAASVQRALHGMLAAKNPGIRDRGVKEASYVVLTGTSMPAILAEVSFVSSPADENNLQNSAYRQRIAEALYKGISRYAEASHSAKMASTSGKPTGQ